jgi:serine/threonine protein kinase/Flp pilus assembly protein TadD
MIGKTVAHYKILERIGEGGMGVVYKAEDTKLKRTVALKFLPAELTRDPQAKARFVQEAQAAAALDHPHICAVYEIGETEGTTFIAMPFIKGQSLRERIAIGPLSMEEALAIAEQVAEGLKEAHDKGIIHRDIKPANIMLTEKGQAKIMDFGLAKLEAGADLTGTMAVIGTVAYMSPEQARGEEVDLRTDIWSFGATLYEMLTGLKPFGQKHDQALLYSILNDTTEMVSRIRPEIPLPLGKVINKALEKDKLRRYQSMGDLFKDLKSTGFSVAGRQKPDKSIIVLPFENISSDPEQEYFCDGMTEEIITDLSNVHDLLVISRSSSMTFKGTKKKAREIAQDVNVRYVLEGSVRKAEDNLRITAQLIDAATDAHVWAEKYSATLDHVFDIQEKVSRSIVDALKIKLSPFELKEIAKRQINNIPAYDYYLKANADIFMYTEEATDRAIRYLNQALELAGNNALLFSGLAFAYWQLANIGVSPKEYLIKARDCAGKALAIEPEFAKAHAALGWIGVLEGNQQEAVHHLKRALAVSPDEAIALVGLCGVYIFAVGKKPAGLQICEKLKQIDPLDFHAFAAPGLLHFYDGQYDEALKIWRKGYELYPDNPYSQFFLALILVYHRELDRAFAVIDQSAKATPDNVVSKLGLILKYGAKRDKESLFNLITPELERTIRQDVGHCFFMAISLAMVDAKEEALDWLENAVERGFLNYPSLAEKDPFLANIRGEPRFQKLMERVKYEWEHFEV